MDTLNHIAKLCESKSNNRDCTLLFDAMSIKSNIFYNKSTGS